MFAIQPQSPDETYGQLFRDVQLEKLFPDKKTFVDCLPKRDPAEIMADYSKLSKDPKFDLNAFVANNFTAPANIEDIVTHIRGLWCVLRRDPAPPVKGSSLLPLPNPYIVPGGRFCEVYYWDSYFTMLGLKGSGDVDLIEDIIKNFASLIDRYGLIPNGNRTYYLARPRLRPARGIRQLDCADRSAAGLRGLANGGTDCC
jgi:alpha,alpha-trehalase